MDSFQSISVLMIVRPLTLWELPGRVEHAISDNRHHPRLCKIPINNLSPHQGRHLPAPRTPHPAPRIFGIESNGACLCEANPDYRR